MLFTPLDIKSRLVKERIRQHKLLDEVQLILQSAYLEDKQILRRLHHPSGNKELAIALDKSDLANVFEEETIKSICIRYRLRFLDSSFYKHEIPYEAVSKIKSLEKKYGTTIEKFKIMAPEKAFNLENINKDPLLFARLANGDYYLVHKWGNDMAWYKKYIYRSLQTPVTFLLSLLAACALISISVPVSWMNIMNFTSEVYLRIWLSIHLFIMFTGFALWAGMAFDKNFSCNTWDSKFFNN